MLPDGAAFSPNASWVLKSRLARFSKKQLKGFVLTCPDFVVELNSPSDRLSRVNAKMRQWIENGAQLGWLIDADRLTVYIYRPGLEPEEQVDVDTLSSEGPVERFVLELGDIWQRIITAVVYLAAAGGVSSNRSITFSF